MPPATAAKLAYNKKHHAANKTQKQFLDAVESILAGRKTQAKTLEKYGWTISQVNRILALVQTFRLVLEDIHGVKLANLYEGRTAMPPLQAAAVQVQPTPVPPAHPILSLGPQGDARQGDRHTHHLGADRHLVGGRYRQARDGLERCPEDYGG